MKSQMNLNKERLPTEQEFTIAYSGPTFESGMKLDKFIENLESLQKLIQTMTDVNLEYKNGYNSSKDIRQIKIKPSAGSIIEDFVIVFANPEARDTILMFLTALFFYLLGKRDMSNELKKLKAEIKTEIKDQIDELIARDQGTNIKNIYRPLERTADKLSIMREGTNIIEIEFGQKSIIDKAINKIEEELEIVETTEELEGYISAVNIDANRLMFHAKGMESAHRLTFDDSISKLTHLIAMPIKAKLKVKRFKDKVRSFHLVGYRTLQRDLNEKQK